MRNHTFGYPFRSGLVLGLTAAVMAMAPAPPAVAADGDAAKERAVRKVFHKSRVSVGKAARLVMKTETADKKELKKAFQHLKAAVKDFKVDKQSRSVAHSLMARKIASAVIRKNGGEVTEADQSDPEEVELADSSVSDEELSEEAESEVIPEEEVTEAAESEPIEFEIGVLED